MGLSLARDLERGSAKRSRSAKGRGNTRGSKKRGGEIHLRTNRFRIWEFNPSKSKGPKCKVGVGRGDKKRLLLNKKMKSDSVKQRKEWESVRLV